MSSAQLQQFRTLTNDEGRPMVNNDRPPQPKRRRAVQFNQSGNSDNVPVLSNPFPIYNRIPLVRNNQHQLSVSRPYSRPHSNYQYDGSRPTYPSPQCNNHATTSRPISSALSSNDERPAHSTPFSSHQIQRQGSQFNQWPLRNNQPSATSVPKSYYSVSYYHNNPTRTNGFVLSQII